MKKKSEIEIVKQVVLMLNREIKVLKTICYLALTCSVITLIIAFLYSHEH